MRLSPQRKTVRYEIEYYLTDVGVTYCDEEKYHIKAEHIQIAYPGQRRYSKLPFNTMYLKFGASGELAALLDAVQPYFKAKSSKQLRALFEQIISLQEEQTSKLLWSSDVAIDEIAAQTGFANQQYFSKVFKAKTGTSPGAYRKGFRRKYFSD